MKPQAIAGKVVAQSEGRKSHPRHSYQKVRDGRKQPIRGLWTRNGYFIARVTVPVPESGRSAAKWVTLTDADGHKISTLAGARPALEKLRTQKHDDDLPVLGKVPTLGEHIPEYLKHREALTGADARRPSTLEKDRSLLAKWAQTYGNLRLNQIKPAHVVRFRDNLLRDGYAARSANLAVITLRGLCKHAKREGFLKSLPMQDLAKLRESTKKRALVTTANIAKLTNSSAQPRFLSSRLAKDGEFGQPLKNARQFADYIWLMAYTGARRNETLRLRWADVDFERGQITIGADGLSKNYESRVVDFHPKLEAHLRAMMARRAPDSQWLFPSPRRGECDTHALTFMESLRLARLAAEMPGFGFHDCRHFFISFAVMSGVDYMTIARWVGHKDGGVLIGKVYGHLSNEHAKAQAQRLNFEPMALPDPGKGFFNGTDL